MIRRPPRSTLFPSTTLSRSRVARRAGLVEPDVPALPDPEELEVDAPRRCDRLLVRPAVLGERLTRHAPVGNVDVLGPRSEEHTSELQSRLHLVCRLLLEKKK